jgi:5'-deoxynucleotidase
MHGVDRQAHCEEQGEEQVKDQFDLDTVLKSGDVRRYHTYRLIHPQTLAEHQWRAAVILMWMFSGAPSVGVLEAVLLHDTAEIITGDMPAPVKWENEELGAQMDLLEAEVEEHLGLSYFLHNLSPSDKLLVQFCDRAELVLFCLQEYDLGNKAMLVVAQRGIDKLRAHAMLEGFAHHYVSRASQLINDLQQRVNRRGANDEGK